MPKFAETTYRNCGYCRTVSVAMAVEWSSRYVKDAAGVIHPQAAMSCPRCGRITLVNFELTSRTGDGKSTLNPADEVVEVGSLPSSDDLGVNVKHLPDDIKQFFQTAQRALLAGIPDAAAVQLRKTLEAAAAAKGIQEKNLFGSVTKLLDGNYLTQDFSGVLDHVRRIGNIGAHYTDTVLTAAEVERSLRFTTQVLRNLFEVPGELEELRAESESVVGEGGEVTDNNKATLVL
jgi:hypothetical protein